MKLLKLIPLAMLMLLASAAVRADVFGTAVGGGIGAVTGAVIGDSMGGRNGAIIGSGVGGAIGAVVGQQISQQPSHSHGYRVSSPAPPVRYVPVHHVQHHYYPQPGRGHAWGHHKHRPHHHPHGGYRYDHHRHHRHH